MDEAESYRAELNQRAHIAQGVPSQPGLMSQLGHAIELLDVQLDRLEGRLKPVQRPSPPETTDTVAQLALNEGETLVLAFSGRIRRLEDNIDRITL